MALQAGRVKAPPSTQAAPGQPWGNREQSVQPDEAGRRLRVVVADDHAVLRAGTRQILEQAGDIEVVGEAADGEEALAQCAILRPDVALLDIRMPGPNGIDVARRLADEQPDVVVVVLSAYDDEAYVRAALACGVGGYLLKTAPAGELVHAVRSAAAGTTVLDPSIIRRLAGSPGGDDPAGLTWRERQVVALVAGGLANKVVGSRLGISVRTVEGHLNHAFTKLGVSTRTELVRFALANGLDSVPDLPAT
ncbi:MAG: response regulator transcription factor [Actinomycetota bacterium]|nr:response regulator transcription factor [Actinomycetota bacterium]